MKKKRELLGVCLTHEEKVRLKQLAEKEERTMSQEARKAIRKHLEEAEEGKGK